MLRFLILFSLLHFLPVKAQIEFSQTNINLGEIKDAYEIKADVIIKNTGAKNLYLLKADGERGIKVFTSKKTIYVGDTALLVISFIPESSGKFSKEIKLYSSTQNDAHLLKIKGQLNHLQTDDKTACYYFGRPNKTTTTKEGPIVINNSPTIRDNSNKMPDNSSEPIITKTIEPLPEKPTSESSKEALPTELYKPNNLVFLMDVSNSMKDSMKLPLLKLALHKLINEVRPIDFITLISYADSIKILAEYKSWSNKETLHTIVDKLKARGLTKGRQAILKSEDILLKHYIKDGNNQLILSTDGKFNFYSEDEKNFLAKQQNNPIVMSVIGFGDDRDAIKNLKEIAQKGKGSFIHVKKKSNCEELLMDEIKQRSKKE